MFDTEWEPRQERDVLPPGLKKMEPGAQLGSALASIDRSDLNGNELVTVLQARARQVAHQQAELYADMWELAFTPPGHVDSPPERSDNLDELASDEVAAALTLTPRSADRQLSLAYSLSRLPTVHDALRRGRIDLSRARALIDETCHLDDREAQEIVDSLLDDAPDLTTRQLAGRLRRRCLELDPDRARRRHEEALEERRVESHPNPDGTADLCARQLPLERIASILGRINSIARQLKGQDERSMDQIRADILIDLLEGRAPHQNHGLGGVEIRVDLPTLLGLSDWPGEIPGWGPVIADTARRLVEEQRDVSWRVVVNDQDAGQPVWSGITRRRPTARQRRHVIARNPTCAFPGCPMPASRSQIDHTIDYAAGGATVTDNLGPLCARHHLRTKHRAGWKLEQRQPGIFTWTSPRQHSYEVRPPPG